MVTLVQLTNNAVQELALQEIEDDVIGCLPKRFTMFDCDAEETRFLHYEHHATAMCTQNLRGKVCAMAEKMVTPALESDSPLSDGTMQLALRGGVLAHKVLDGVS